jgi:hypothetical protein
MSLLVLCLSFAFAGDGPPPLPAGPDAVLPGATAPTEAPGAIATPAPADDPASPTLAARIDEAIRVRQKGDVDAARALLVALEPFVPAETLPWYLYQRGICEELDWQPDAARAFYEQVIALGGDVALDAHFRRALVLEDLGQDAAALTEVLTLDHMGGLSAEDDITVELQRGVTELALGRRVKGIRHIEAGLAATEGGDTHRYLRAKGRYALAAALLAEADRLSLTGPEKRVVKHLKGRAERIQAAEKQIVALTALKEPEWVLASLIALGDSYGRLATDLAASTVPRRLSPDEAAIYRAELAKKAENVRTKSFHAYDQGVTVAARLGWESPRVATLSARRAALEAVR